MQRIEEGAAGERARVCSRPDEKSGVDSGHQSSPVQSSPVQSSPGFPSGRAGCRNDRIIYVDLALK